MIDQINAFISFRTVVAILGSLFLANLLVKALRFGLAARRWFRTKRILQEQFPSAPGGHWLLGHAKEMQEPLCHHKLTELSTKLGKAFYMRMAWHQVRLNCNIALHRKQVETHLISLYDLWYHFKMGGGPFSVTSDSESLPSEVDDLSKASLGGSVKILVRTSHMTFPHNSGT